MQRAGIVDQHVEAVVIRTDAGEVVGVHARRPVTAQEIADDETARAATPLRALGRTDIGQRREPPTGVDGEPGPARFQVASTDDVREILPSRGGRRRACMELVAVGGEHQAIARAAVMGDE